MRFIGGGVGILEEKKNTECARARQSGSEFTNRLESSEGNMCMEGVVDWKVTRKKDSVEERDAYWPRALLRDSSGDRKRRKEKETK